MVRESTKQAVQNLESAINCMGNNEDMDYIVEHMTRLHRTLVQSFTGKFVLQYVRQLALDYANGNYDLRNESACKICHGMWNAFCKEYGYDVLDKPGLVMI